MEELLDLLPISEDDSNEKLIDLIKKVYSSDDCCRLFVKMCNEGVLGYLDAFDYILNGSGAYGNYIVDISSFNEDMWHYNRTENKQMCEMVIDAFDDLSLPTDPKVSSIVGINSIDQESVDYISKITDNDGKIMKEYNMLDVLDSLTLEECKTIIKNVYLSILRITLMQRKKKVLSGISHNQIPLLINETLVKMENKVITENIYFSNREDIISYLVYESLDIIQSHPAIESTKDSILTFQLLTSMFGNHNICKYEKCYELCGNNDYCQECSRMINMMGMAMKLIG